MRFDYVIIVCRSFLLIIFGKSVFKILVSLNIQNVWQKVFVFLNKRVEQLRYANVSTCYQYYNLQNRVGQ